MLIISLLPVVALADAPTSQPVTPAEAIYRSNLALARLLLENPSDDQLLHLGRLHRSRGDFSRAAVLHLTALRDGKNRADLEYELACDFALWGQSKLGMEYLQKAADDGYWGYRIVHEDTDLASLKNDPGFAAAEEKIQKTFATEAPQHAPGMTEKVPSGQAPAAGWPVVFFLHGWGSNRHDFDEDASFVATLGYVGVTLDGNEPMGPGAYSWGHESIEPTTARIEAAIKSLSVPTDPKRVYLQGFSQGAMYAARLLADHPELYAGAICNSPGSAWLLPVKLAIPAQTGSIVLSVASHDAPGIDKNVAALESLWRSAGRPVHVIRFDGGHQLPPNPQAMLQTALEELSAGN